MSKTTRRPRALRLRWSPEIISFRLFIIRCGMSFPKHSLDVKHKTHFSIIISLHLPQIPLSGRLQLHISLPQGNEIPLEMRCRFHLKGAAKSVITPSSSHQFSFPTLPSPRSTKTIHHATQNVQLSFQKAGPHRAGLHPIEQARACTIGRDRNGHGHPSRVLGPPSVIVITLREVKTQWWYLDQCPATGQLHNSSLSPL